MTEVPGLAVKAKVKTIFLEMEYSAGGGRGNQEAQNSSWSHIITFDILGLLLFRNGVLRLVYLVWLSFLQV